LKSGVGWAQGLVGREFALCPGADGAAVVVGQGLVGASFFLNLDHVLGAEQLAAVVAQVLVELQGGVGQDWMQGANPFSTDYAVGGSKLTPAA
jgi:hypothetical protein